MAQKPPKFTTSQALKAALPVGNTGITLTSTKISPSGVVAKPRINLDLSPPVLLLLDYVCEVTGAAKTTVITEALLQALPALIERAEFISRGAPVKKK